MAWLKDWLMKLYMTDNSELMEIVSIQQQSGTLIIEGFIMGAMPVRAVVKPAEMRSALSLMTLSTKWAAFLMLFRSSR
jgi:hypothetical protein